MLVERVRLSDAEQLANLYNDVEEQSPYSLIERGERTITKEYMEKYIQTLNKRPVLLLVAKYEERVVGYIRLERGTLRCDCHTANIAIGVHNGYHRMGIATALFEQAELMAKQVGITHLKLDVLSHNLPALFLYLKRDFVVEGTRNTLYKHNNNYITIYHMTKTL